MNHHASIKIRAPWVFNPKVTPDPTESERLQAKLNEAAQRLRSGLMEVSRYTRNDGSQRSLDNLVLHMPFADRLNRHNHKRLALRR